MGFGDESLDSEGAPGQGQGREGYVEEPGQTSFRKTLGPLVVAWGTAQGLKDANGVIWSQINRAQTLTLSVSSCASLDQSLSLSEPRLPCL